MQQAAAMQAAADSTPLWLPAPPAGAGGVAPHALEELDMRPAEHVPVYVMLPLDTVNAEGVFRYASVPWFAQALRVLALSGVHGVAVDVWWCAVECAPRRYCWTAYKQLCEVVRAAGLRLQVVLSFHACGGNVGDVAQVPLPPWVLQAGASDPDIFFTDRPRESGLGRRNKECLSFWADEAPVLPCGGPMPPSGGGSGAAGANSSSSSCGGGGGGPPGSPLPSPTGGVAAVSSSGSGNNGGSSNSSAGASSGHRTPLQCYADFMAAFRDEFGPQLGHLIEEVVVGSGPCGEVRYPSYLEANGWRFPGVGEFICYDRRALASLAAAAEAAGRPEWGYAGPHDSGAYNSAPADTGFFKPRGSWDTEYGQFFLSWYSRELLQHGERLMQASSEVFAGYRVSQQQQQEQQRAARLSQAHAILQQVLQVLAGGSGGRCSDASGLVTAAAAAVTAAVAAVATGAADSGPGATAAAVERSLALLQQLVPAPHGGESDAAAAAATGSAAEAAAAAPAAGISQPAAGDGSSVAAAASQEVPQDVQQLAGDLLQQLLQGCDLAASLQLTSAAVGGNGLGSSQSSNSSSSSLLSAIAAAAADAACGSMAAAAGAAAAAPAAAPSGPSGYQQQGAGGCGSVSSMPTASSLHSSGSAVDLSMSDVLSASQQHLASLSLQDSRGSELQLAANSSSSALLQPVFEQLPISEPTGCNSAGINSGPPAVAAAASRGSSTMDCSSIPSSSSPQSGSAGEHFGASTSSCSSLLAAGDAGAASGAASAGAPAAAAAGTSTSTPAQAAAALLQTFLKQLLSSQQQQSQQVPHEQQQSPSQLSPAHQQLVLQQQASQRAAAAVARKPLVLSLKIAGVHWWYNSTSHASELTAGYYNTESRDGYGAILDLCGRYAFNLTITCVEMCDAQHPPYALCGPEGLLRQIRAMAAARGVTLSGENALPIFTPGGVDASALDRVVSNVRACRLAQLRSCSSWPGPGAISNAAAGGGAGGYGSSASSGGGVSSQQHQLLQQQQHFTYQQQQQHVRLAQPQAGSTSTASSGGGGWAAQQVQQQAAQAAQLRRQQVAAPHWAGGARVGGHQHTGAHIMSTNRNFSELGSLLATYGSGGSFSNGGSGASTPAEGGSLGAPLTHSGFSNGAWQQQPPLPLPHQQQQQQQQKQQAGSASNAGGAHAPPAGNGGGSTSNRSSQHGQQQQQQQQHSGGGSSSGGSGVLPAMRAFTFLRLGPEILQSDCHTSWMRFMHRMLNERA